MDVIVKTQRCKNCQWSTDYIERDVLANTQKKYGFVCIQTQRELKDLKTLSIVLTIANPVRIMKMNNLPTHSIERLRISRREVNNGKTKS